MIDKMAKGAIKTIIKNILPYGISNYFAQKTKEIPSPDEPPVYNAEGQKLKVLFLSSAISHHYPYCFVTGQYPQRILWDRNNFGLKNHFYVHEKILGIQGKPEKKFALFIESESIVPNDYKLFYRHPGLEKDFELIFTHSAQFLDKYSNAAFVPAAGVWYGTTFWGGTLNPDQYKLKTKNISLLASSKANCDLQKFRLALAKYYKNNTSVDTYGSFDEGNTIALNIPFESYRYSIAIENYISPYYFTEKILNCFASMTVPIYIGATSIEKFFNPQGIIQVTSFEYDDIDKIVKQCCEKDYMARIPALIDNFNRVKEHLCLEDYLFKHYQMVFV